MKTLLEPEARLIRCCLGLVLVLALSGCAGNKRPLPLVPPRNIRAEVTAEFEHSILGWNSGQLDMFVGIYAEDATFALRDGFLRGYPAIRSYYAPRFLPNAIRGSLTFDEFDVQVLTLDLVLVRAVYLNRVPGEEPARGTTTLLLRNIGGRWRIIHDHST